MKKIPCRLNSPAKAIEAYSVLLFFFFSLFFSASVFGETGGGSLGWEEISYSGGIRVFKKEVQDSPILALKGETILDFPIGRVAAVMDQIEKQPQWVPYLVEAKQLKRISFYERLIYTCSDSPWPVRDRDFLAHSSVDVNKHERKITVNMRSVEGPEAPVRGDRVRGEIASCVIVLQALDGGKRTYFSMEMMVDPKGWIPQWVVTLAQKKWTRKYIEGLRGQAAKPEIKDHPLVLELLGIGGHGLPGKPQN